jgi:anti-sigma B factor antagonist
MSFSLTRREIAGVTVIDIGGRLTLGEATAMFRELIHREADQNSRLVLNIADVAYVDSAGLGEMIGCQMAVNERGGALKLLHVRHLVKHVIQAARLYTHFEIFEDEPTAVRSFPQ